MTTSIEQRYTSPAPSTSSSKQPQKSASQPAPCRSELEPLSAVLAPALDDLPRIPRQARSREKRDALLRSAAEVFTQRGYPATSADLIAETAGVSIGTFYNYFRNKRQILLALVTAQLDDIFGHLRLAQLDLSRGNASQHIREAVAAALQENERSGLQRVWQELMSSEPELIPYQQTIRDYAHQQLSAQLCLAQQRGNTWEHLDVEVTALAILALVDSLSTRVGYPLEKQRIIDGVADLIYHAIYRPHD